MRLKLRKLATRLTFYLSSMSRALCPKCQRPEKACICAFSVVTNNTVHVVVLQHPNEVKQSKGTVTLLQQSLVHCEVIVGENFESNESLAALLAQYGEQVALLYPSEGAIELNFSTNQGVTINNEETLARAEKVKCIIILDGTWKKAYRMFMLNPCLHNIQHLVLPKDIESLYDIRSTKKDHALSSLEACCHALARLEDNKEKYQDLLANFVKFNQFVQSFNQHIK